jgi:hypothetical protein
VIIVRSIISGCRLRLAATNYNKLKNPTETAKLIRANELHNLEMDFWKQELKQVVGEKNMKLYYDRLNEQRLLWNGENLSENQIAILFSKQLL